MSSLTLFGGENMYLVQDVGDNFNSDHTLITELKSDSANAWSFLYEKYVPVLVSFINSRGFCEPHANDIIQETFLSFYNKLPSFSYDSDKGKLRTYLKKVAESKMIDLYRKNKRYSFMENPTELISCNDQDLEQVYPEDDEYDEALVCSAIDKVKGRVQKRTFKCFEYSYINGAKVARVADKLVIPRTRAH